MVSITLRSQFWLEQIRWTKVYMNEIRCMWLCCQLPLLVFYTIYKLYNDVALHYNEWSWLMKVKNHCRQKLKLLSLFWTHMCSIRIDTYWSWWAKKQNLFFILHTCMQWIYEWMASVSLPDNVFQLFFALLHRINISCWWCLMMCKAIRCRNIRNSRIFCFWFCIVRACNYKRQNPPTLQKEKKKGT